MCNYKIGAAHKGGKIECATVPFKWRNEIVKNTNSCYNTKPREIILIAIAKEEV
jgi:hypothetical protein